MVKHIWWLAFLALAACSRSGSLQGTDSSTHWLDVCRKDSDCGETWECICGVCAAQCETQSPCEDVASNRAGVCSTLSCKSHAEVGICTLACNSEVPCPRAWIARTACAFRTTRALSSLALRQMPQSPPTRPCSMRESQARVRCFRPTIRNPVSRPRHPRRMDPASIRRTIPWHRQLWTSLPPRFWKPHASS